MESARIRERRVKERARHHADTVHLEALGVLADGTASKQGRGEQKDSCTSSNDACSPDEGMVRSDEAEATGSDFVDSLCESDAESKDWF
jgi:hypothetical protein|tara:strand:+ start:347 stop:613 length:267 start_codon:yes stop_codon:yes gene_type:complete